MKWDEQQENAVDKLTADQIKTAMNKWVKPEKIIIVEAGEFDKKKN
jgi:predicted Zn-dependent peptidase